MGRIIFSSNDKGSVSYEYDLESACPEHDDIHKKTITPREIVEVDADGTNSTADSESIERIDTSSTAEVGMVYQQQHNPEVPSPADPSLRERRWRTVCCMSYAGVLLFVAEIKSFTQGREQLYPILTAFAKYFHRMFLFHIFGLLGLWLLHQTIAELTERSHRGRLLHEDFYAFAVEALALWVFMNFWYALAVAGN
ncbi:hypothetical protein NA57DRAFT_80640 [Rhizodiscina lignyota]|uniref:Uncharacterized protein n=1 Tax=Rhizodiscina lignyota TaxID=1504668 RepID=A0A9P4M271_9PEZI|nr:hypothetical protein NA57DRAFT_80640 [Rhizodiscina lignyota]